MIIDLALTASESIRQPGMLTETGADRLFHHGNLDHFPVVTDPEPPCLPNRRTPERTVTSFDFLDDLIICELGGLKKLFG